MSSLKCGGQVLRKIDGLQMNAKAKSLRLEGVAKRFGSTMALAETMLDVPAGEFLTLLGPSGCGKTTLLRLIAGLEGVSAGRILVGGEDVTFRPPHQRDTGICFQDYALFPHKSLYDNIAYGLKMRGVASDARRQAAEAWLTRIGLTGYGDRRPHELSGGQRQRVALARALIVEPGILLLDEPLGALDAHLRRQMQGELMRMHAEIGLTFIYVTHDQDEAMSMSQRIAVMRKGRIEQIGTPKEIYDHPRNRFVAGFVGACSILEGVVARDAAAAVFRLADEDGVLPVTKATAEGPAAMALRPEALRLSMNGNAPALSGKIARFAFTGNHWRIAAQLASGKEIEALLPRETVPEAALQAGNAIRLEAAPDALKRLEDEPE